MSKNDQNMFVNSVPNEEGWYWLRCKGGDWQIVELIRYEDNSSVRMEVRFSGMEMGRDAEQLSSKGTVFIGPLKPPKTTGTKK